VSLGSLCIHHNVLLENVVRVRFMNPVQFNRRNHSINTIKKKKRYPSSRAAVIVVPLFLLSSSSHDVSVCLFMIYMIYVIYDICYIMMMNVYDVADR
jgi:hypothetical protein